MHRKMQAWEGIPALLLLICCLTPFLLAWERLDETSGIGLLEAIESLQNRRQTRDAVQFSILIGLASAVCTAIVGVPLAFALGRWRMPCHGTMKLLATLPFITPSIVAAMGFLELFRNEGWFHSATGLSLISETGIIADFSEASGIAHPGWFIAILIAHVWFNIALFVRLIEPVVSRLDEAVVEQIRLLPAGETLIGRVRTLWIPLLRMHAASAMVLTFVFCATSFALIMHLGGFEYYTMERAMAELGGAAGICADGALRCYGADSSQVVMALSAVQLVIILLALWVQSTLARRMRNPWPMTADGGRSLDLSTLRGRLVFAGLLSTGVFLASPLLSIIRAGFRVAGEYSTKAWVKAFSHSSTGGMDLLGHLQNSLLYALLTAMIVIPVALILSEVCIRAERRADEGIRTGYNRLWSSFNEILALSPLALSGVMIGYGILVGLIRLEPGLIRSWWIPLLGHCLVALPFAVKGILQSTRNIDIGHEEVAATLGLAPLQVWLKVRLGLLRSSLIVSTGLVMAISLGEFGASWVVIRSTDFATLPIFIDSTINRPFDILARPMAMVAATVLLICCAVIHLTVERFRSEMDGGGF